MMRTGLLLLYVGILSIHGVLSVMYDCRRDNPLCSNQGDCQKDSGLCVCNAPTILDYACFLDTTTIPVPCIKECTNGGTCNGSPEACFCPPDFYGEFCEKRRAFVTCEGNKMQIRLRPYSEPNQIYVPSFKDSPECTAVKNLATEDYEISIDFDGGVCGAGAGDTILADSPGAGDTTYQNFLVVQYSGQVESPLDDIYTISCLISANNTMPVEGIVSTINVDQRNDLLKGEARGTYKGLLFELLDDVGTLLTAAQLGIIIKLRISLKDTNVYKAIKVQSCEAKDKYVDETSSLLLASNGCASLDVPASYVIRSGFKGDVLAPDNLPYVELTITAFKFTTSPEVHFTCTVLLCRDGDTSCDPTEVCPFGESKGKRKKRGSGSEAEISGTLKIIDPFERSRTLTVQRPSYSTTEAPDVQEECVMSREIMVILITLGITVLLLAVVCVLLAMRYIRIRSITTKTEEPRYTVPVINMSKSY